MDRVRHLVALVAVCACSCAAACSGRDHHAPQAGAAQPPVHPAAATASATANDAGPPPRATQAASARDAAPTAPPPAPRPDDLVDIADIDPRIQIDMRYATARNFTHVAFYPVARCPLRRAVAEKLRRVEDALARRGLGLEVWDCYRPFSAQQRLWKLMPDPRYVARPVAAPDGTPRSGSKHNRGAAVDLTLVDASGHELEMPTDHDDFSARAHRPSPGASAAARENSAILEHAMAAEGFTPLRTEWWHFDAPGWKRYPLSNQPLDHIGVR